MKHRVAAALGIALSLALTPVAGAATEHDDGTPRDMEFRCRDVSHRVDTPAVACWWSTVPAGGYRLVRADREGGRGVVFRTEDPREHRHLDRTAEAGTTYVYVVQALGRGGVVAQSDPVRVAVGGPHEDRTGAMDRPLRR